MEKQFEDTKRVTTSHESKTSKQHNSQKKKRQTVIFKTLLRKLKIEQHEPYK
jgi:hypothetical protein